MSNFWQYFLQSISFLTVLPVQPFIRYKKMGNDFLSKASWFFPLVGLLIGLILFLAHECLQWFGFDNKLSGALILAIWIILTGGLHLEGLADMIDGFSGGKNKEEIIQIMKDGAIGAKGAIAVIMYLLIKWLLLCAVSVPMQSQSLLIVPVISRWSMVLTGYWGRAASSNNTMTHLFVDHLGRKEVFISTLFVVGISLVFLSYHSFYLLFLAVIIVRVLIGYAHFRMGGISGDIIGSVNELTELLALLGFYFSFFIYPSLY